MSPDDPFFSIAQNARESNLRRAAALSAAIAAAEDGRLDARSCAQAKEIAHQVAGSAGTFGFADVSLLAKDLETFFVRWTTAEAGNVHQAREQLDAIEAQLREGQPQDF